jgi:hypothetical protein
MAAPALKPRVLDIELKYDFKTGKVSVVKPAHLVAKNKKLRLQKGDILTFSCPQGSLDLQFTPTYAYAPDEVTTSGPNVPSEGVKVTGFLGPAGGMIRCGGTFKKPATTRGNGPRAAKVVKIDPGDGSGIITEP